MIFQIEVIEIARLAGVSPDECDMDRLAKLADEVRNGNLDREKAAEILKNPPTSDEDFHLLLL